MFRLLQMEKLTVDLLFDRYYRKRKKGSGIGLSNVKELIHRMHGEVAVESVPKAGISFVFKLPLIPDK